LYSEYLYTGKDKDIKIRQISGAKAREKEKD
jgi:hypothetical protein